jgi:hypothetical protein
VGGADGGCRAWQTGRDYVRVSMDGYGRGRFDLDR